MLASKEPKERDVLSCRGPSHYWGQIQKVRATHQLRRIGANRSARTWLGKEANGCRALSSGVSQGRSGGGKGWDTGLRGSGLNWMSGVGTRTKAGGRALEGAGAL